jgi:hypothetical protein
MFKLREDINTQALTTVSKPTGNFFVWQLVNSISVFVVTGHVHDTVLNSGSHFYDGNIGETGGSQ